MESQDSFGLNGQYNPKDITSNLQNKLVDIFHDCKEVMATRITVFGVLTQKYSAKQVQFKMRI